MFWPIVPELRLALVIGTLGTVVWLFPHFAWPASVVFFLLWMQWIVFTVKIIYSSWKKMWKVTKFSILGICSLLLLGLAFIIFPEKGFDALWYHLPLTELFLHNETQSYIPELYQSAMPKLGSAVAAMGYVPGAFVSEPVRGARIVFWVVSVLAVVLAYRVARKVTKQSVAAVTVLAFCSFQVMGWQLSSVYVDLLRFFFELAALYLLIEEKGKRNIFLSGMFLGFAFGTKLLSGFFLPIWLIYAVLTGGKKIIAPIVVGFLTTALPWIVYALVWTGNPVFPLFQFLDGAEQLTHMGVSGWGEWVLKSIAHFPLLPVLLPFHIEGYTTPLFLFSLPFLLLYFWKSRWRDPLIWFSLLGLAMWSVIPPLSIRYGLIFLFVWLLCSMKALVAGKQKIFFQIGVCLVFISFFFHLGIRTFLFISEYQQCSPHLEACLQKHAVGLAAGPFERWYEGYWSAVAHRTLVPAMDSTLQPVVR
jgi:hypothetical protein